MDAINRSATRRKTLHCRINQGIHLDSIETGFASIQFKISFHDQDCFHTLFVYFDCRPDVFDIGIVNRHGVHSCIHLTISPELGSSDLVSSLPGRDQLGLRPMASASTVENGLGSGSPMTFRRYSATCRRTGRMRVVTPPSAPISPRRVGRLATHDRRPGCCKRSNMPLPPRGGPILQLGPEETTSEAAAAPQFDGTTKLWRDIGAHFRQQSA